MYYSIWSLKGQVLPKMIMREFSFFITFSDTYTCTYVVCSREVAETARLITYSFSSEEVDRHVVLYKKVQSLYC